MISRRIKIIGSEILRQTRRVTTSREMEGKMMNGKVGGFGRSGGKKVVGAP